MYEASKALVLIGNTGSGKDTLCRHLQQKFANVHNAKFGRFPKDLLSSIAMLPDGVLEDKERRVRPVFEGVSYLDILNLLFHGLSSNPIVEHKVINYCLDSIPIGSFPVFTDIRREQEMDAVLEAFDVTLAVYLDRYDITPGAGDSKIPWLIDYCDLDASSWGKTEAEWCLGVEHIFSSLFQPKNMSLKPTLHVYTELPQNVSGLPSYEPLSHLLEDLFSLAKAHGIHTLAALSVFSDLANEIKSDNVSPVTEDSYIVINQNHFRFMPAVKQHANLVIHYGKNTQLNDRVKELRL